jgi:hypothetical protein
MLLIFLLTSKMILLSLHWSTLLLLLLLLMLLMFLPLLFLPLLFLMLLRQLLLLLLHLIHYCHSKCCGEDSSIPTTATTERNSSSRSSSLRAWPRQQPGVLG